MVSRSSLTLTAVLALLGTVPVAAQQATGKRFTLDIPTIMQGPEHYGREPGGVSWSADSRYIRFSWAPPGTAWDGNTQNYRVLAQPGATPELVTGAMTQEMSGGMAAMSGSLNRDRTRKLIVSQGSVWLWDMAADTGRRLSRTSVTPQVQGWSADEKSFFYRVGDAFYSFRLDDGYVQELAEIRSAPQANAGSQANPAGRGGAGGIQAGRGGVGSQSSPIAAALQRDQRQLFEAISGQGGRGGARGNFGAQQGGRGTQGGQAQQGGRGGQGQGGRGGQQLQGGRGRGGFGAGSAAPAGNGDATRLVTLSDGETLRSVSLSPSGKALVFTVATGYTSTPTLIPRWITASGYVETSNGRAKVGDAGGTSRIALLNLDNGRVTWLYPIPGDSTDRYTGLSLMGWNESGSTALVSATSSDYKLKTLSALDAATGTLKPIEILRDSTWIGGPSSGAGGWLPGQDAIWFVNESDGYAHVYTVNADGSNRKQLTRGPFEVNRVVLSQERNRFEMLTSEGSPFEQHFWTMNLDGSNKVRYTKRPGSHTTTLSPDGKWLADVFSYSNEPPELYIQPATPMAEASRLTTSPTAEWRAFKWIDPEIVMIPASDGKQVPARIYRPKDMGAKANGAAVIFVHGAGYLHNVGRFWASSYPREYMFNHLLASQGYVVLDLDYRASQGYGHDWRTAIHKWMGGRDLQDQVDASKWLKKNYGIPGNRVGIYGGSYGGFITLMALFTEPDYFGAGAALRSVTDWAHYNHGYTAPILGLPQDDSAAYHRSSPIYFAEGLRAPLLMAHGMVDSNVEFQDIVRLTQRLIELGKSNWTLAPYPVEDHGFSRPDSWTDEYTRIYQLFQTTIGKK